MEITCSGHATIWTTVPHHPDATLKQERFLEITAVTHLNPQPINRGPWALRTARISVLNSLRA